MTLPTVSPLEARLPTGINGVLSEVGQHDRFQLKVPPGKKLGIQIWADRLGLPVDPVAVARIPAGPELGRGDDAAGARDPQFQITVPGDKDSIEIEVWDLLGRGGEDCRYRIEIADVDAPALNLSLEQDSVAVSQDGGALLVVPINRQRFSGELQLGLAEEIPGVEVSGGWVPADSDRGLIYLHRTGEVTPTVTQIVARADVPGLETVAAKRAATALSPQLPWQDRMLALAPTQDIGLSIANRSLTSETVLWQGGVLRLPDRFDAG